MARWGLFRPVPLAVIAVAPEGERQVAELSGDHHKPVVQVRAQFQRQKFADIPAIDPAAAPFQVMFVGRVEEFKGVLDIPDMARSIEDRTPGLVRWTVCGKG